MLCKLQGCIEKCFLVLGLGKVCVEFFMIVEIFLVEVVVLLECNWLLCIVVGVIVVLGVVVQFVVVKFLYIEDVEVNIGLLQSLEVVVNLFILFGGVLWFLMMLEEWLKCCCVLDVLYVLWFMVYVIDMYQLIKDLVVLVCECVLSWVMSKFELICYFDYCVEMLVLIGKFVVLFVECMCDLVVIEVVMEIENLIIGFVCKIWQKIVVIGEMEEMLLFFVGGV